MITSSELAVIKTIFMSVLCVRVFIHIASRNLKSQSHISESESESLSCKHAPGTSELAVQNRSQRDFPLRKSARSRLADSQCI